MQKDVKQYRQTWFNCLLINIKVKRCVRWMPDNYCKFGSILMKITQITLTLVSTAKNWNEQIKSHSYTLDTLWFLLVPIE